jgi:DNA-binding XRE family transcriptional regulator
MKNENTLLINRLKVGLLLKAIREERDISQRDMAVKVGYANPTFTCSVEKGNSNIPIDKVYDFAREYALPGERDILGAAILKNLHADCWSTSCKIILSLTSSQQNIKDFDKEVDVWMSKELKRLKINIAA